MHKIVEVYKPVGKTPFEIVTEYRHANKIPDHIKMAYAGRLDPMADGMMTILIGDATKQQIHFLKSDKVYDFSVLLGISTDSYDLLGLTDKNSICIPDPLSVEKFIDIMMQNKGQFVQTYPPFSGYLLNGRTMHSLARTGELYEIPQDQWPARKREIFSMRYNSTKSISIRELHKYIQKYIPFINGYFRQDDIMKRWDEIFRNLSNDLTLPLVSFTAHVSSGTFIRSLAHETGLNVGIPALAMTITRTKIVHQNFQNPTQKDHEAK